MHAILFFVGLLTGWVLSVSICAIRLAPVPKLRKSFTFNSVDDSLTNKLIDRFLNLKLGKNKYSVWYYQGHIRDPVNGRKIVGIEGIEKVGSSNQKNASTFIGSTNLTVIESNDHLNSIVGTPNSYFSHKVFLYVDVNNRTNPILSFRKTKMAPARKVNPFNEILEFIQLEPHLPLQHQSTLIYDKNSIIDESSSRFPQKVNTSPYRLRSTIIWPGGRLIEGRMDIEEDVSKEDLPASLLVNHSIRGRKRKIVNKWIEFGPNEESSMGKSNEIYRIMEASKPRKKYWFFQKKMTLKNAQDQFSQHILTSASMVYKRYGLSPAWMAPNKPCEIELHGYRLSSIDHIPDSVKSTFRPFIGDYFNSSRPMESLMNDINRDPLSKFKPWHKKLTLLIYR